jgi:RNase adaptor protein for sRNA GlmZ degradation
VHEELLHATCVALQGKIGVLLRGPSGAGKSDLALRLVDGGGRLIADDQTLLVRRDGGLVARCPETIAGRIEVRGVGIADLPTGREARVDLVVDLVSAAEIERLPAPAVCELLGVELPLLKLDPFEASAAAKLRVAAATRAAMAKTASSDAVSDPAAIRQLVLVTGMSGAGRSTALSILEDLGFESIDNPPLDLLDHLLGEGETRPMAVGVDIRTRHFAVAPVLEQLDRRLGDPALRLTLLFLDCEDDVLLRRYTETRRRHPLAQGRPLSDGIEAERRSIAALRARADLVVDTSNRTIAELRQVLGRHFEAGPSDRMTVCVTSFAFANGLPREADLVFDVRFLRNPHYDRALRPLTGRDAGVAAYVAADPDFETFFERMTALLAPLLPRYRREGKSYLTIAVGCTGGRHRSVSVAERLAGWLEAKDEHVTLNHRDLDTAGRAGSDEA